MDMGLRFKSMEKALTDVIIPALKDSHGLAVEQAHFLLFHVRLIGAQFDKELHLQHADLRDIAALTEQLLADTVANEAVKERARAALAQCDALRKLRLPDRQELIERTVELKAAADELLRWAMASADSGGRARVSKLAMDYAERDITRRRVWVLGAGYDLEADQLPSIDEVLA